MRQIQRHHRSIARDVRTKFKAGVLIGAPTVLLNARRRGAGGTGLRFKRAQQLNRAVTKAQIRTCRQQFVGRFNDLNSHDGVSGTTKFVHRVVPKLVGPRRIKQNIHNVAIGTDRFNAIHGIREG